MKPTAHRTPVFQKFIYPTALSMIGCAVNIHTIRSGCDELGVKLDKFHDSIEPDLQALGEKTYDLSERSFDDIEYKPLSTEGNLAKIEGRLQKIESMQKKMDNRTERICAQLTALNQRQSETEARVRAQFHKLFWECANKK